MTKKEMAKNKRQAKTRANRRLSDGEHHRLMAQAMAARTDGDLPIIDQDTLDMKKSVGHTRGTNHLDFTKGNSPKVRILANKIAENLTDVTEVKSNTTKGGNNRRLNSKQYKSLMSKVAKELGINDDEHSVLELQKRGKPMTTAQLMEQILFSLSYSQWGIYEEYQRIVKSKRIKVKDRMGLIGWLMYPNEVTKPMFLIPAKEKTNEPRNRTIGLKKWGDVKIHPVRVVPDDEYIREVKGKRRKKTDVFDRMSLDDKIGWARHAKSVLGDEDKQVAAVVGFHKTQALFNSSEIDLIKVSMKYACKMVGMKSFRGMYAEPYWIVYRINKYCKESTSKEYDTFLEVAQEHMGWGKKKTLPILSSEEFHKKLFGMLKHLGLDGEYKNWSKENKNEVGFEGMSVKKVRNLIQGYYRTH